MLLLKYKNLTRRQVLSFAAGAAAANAFAPIVPRVEAAEADTGDIKRYTYWFEMVMPIDTNLANENYQQNFGPLQFRNNFTPFNDDAIRDKVLFLRNVRRPTSDNGDGPHPSGVAGITGWKGGGNSRYNPHATSVGQHLAQKFTGKTTFKDIRAGYINKNDKDGDYSRSMSVIKGAPQERYQTPVALYDDVFKDISAGGSSNGNASDLLRQRKSILDNLRSSMTRLKNKVSHFDNIRIQAHQDAIRATETQLTGIIDNVGTCDVTQTNQGDAEPNVVFPVYSDLLTQAFACNLTRVGGAHFGTALAGIRYSFLPSYNGGGKGFHAATHGKHSGAAYIRDVLKFRAEQISGYLKKLESVEEPNGKTLLDNTFFFMTTDVARKHDNTNDQLVIMAGATDRLKKHGQMVNAQGVNHNDILTTITHYMGEPVDKYGDTQFTNGVLPNSLFE